MPDELVHLGYAVGSARPVMIPVRHMAVTGQTQASGKTTTLEALVKRFGAPALAFVTKRGETSFSDARRIQPYFRDRADWQFVDSLIAAQLGEKNKFLRPWLIRICRTTRTLADVQAEVRRALPKARGIHEGVYTQIDAYLELIVPEIRRARLADRIELWPGLNVMDVSSYSTPMQMLFVQSAIDWVNAHLTNVVVVVPEAWEFIPEGKGSPVKASAVALVRKGAALRNYIWVDSQDMAGVDKVILRGCTVWLIGVQREANEIKRNLLNIPASIKRPKASDVAMLERGQFYVCYEKETIKVYVQPTWMSDRDAAMVAKGLMSVPDTRIERESMHSPTSGYPYREEETVTPAEAKALKDENDLLRDRVRNLEDRLRLFKAEDEPEPVRTDASTKAGLYGGGGGEESSIDSIYESFKRRLLAEPKLLALAMTQPELRVEVERHMVTIDGASVKGRVAKLMAKGFTDDTKRFADIKKELERTGAQVNNRSLSVVLDDFVKMGFLTRELDPDGYRMVANMKVNVVPK